MKLTNEQRMAICRILLDVVNEVGEDVSLIRSRHYPALQEKAQLTDGDFYAASQVTVLASITLVKDIHYKLKMLMGLTVFELYSQCKQVTLQQRVTFGILMNAIDWPISFSEISTLS
ncbi:hypothetical protein [Parabacteroides chinchillae]|nr:hypothetical protein [Parabacteroides chinchillae]